MVAGLGIVQLLPPFPGVPWGRHALGVPLIVLGAGVSVTAYVEWRRTQAALRHGTPLPRSVLPQLLAGTITGVRPPQEEPVQVLWLHGPLGTVPVSQRSLLPSQVPWSNYRPAR